MKNKGYCVVIGASGDIGSEICRALAGDRWNLYLHYYSNEEAVNSLTYELREAHPALRFIPVQADFTKQDGADVLLAKVKDVGAVVMAAGQPLYHLLSETTVQEMQELWTVHVQNPARFIGQVSSQLRQQSTAYVVVIGSIWGETGAAGEVMYSAVKGAQHSFIKAYAKEAAYSNILVNGVSPGWIETRMSPDIPEEDRQAIVEQIPLMKTGTPKDVAQVVSFLLSGKADYMTGEIIKINGGWYM